MLKTFAIAGVLLLAPTAASATACDLIHGTYVTGALGKFDDDLSALGFARIEFVHGVGVGRQTLSSAISPSAQHVHLKVTCAPLAQTVARMTFTSALGGTSVFTDAGSADYYIFDGGARIWSQSWNTARPLSGWSFRQPAAPRVQRFP